MIGSPTTIPDTVKLPLPDAIVVRDVEICIYDNAGEINPVEWGEVIRQQNSFLCLDYLKAIENAHDEGLELRFVVFRYNKNVIGAAAFQITHFTTSDDAYSNAFLKALNHVVGFFRGKHVHNILICGNAIATGEHGFSFDPAVTRSFSAGLIAEAMKQIAKQEKQKGKAICAMVVKDFYPDSAGYADELSAFRFRKFQVDHNMVMPVLPEWKSFDDYLASLNTKFRTKAKAAINKSKSLEVIEANAHVLLDVLPQLQTLYDNVNSKADFRLGKLNVNALPEMLDALPGKFFVKLYKWDNNIVGFMSAMKCGTTLEAHVIGIDYEHNKELGVYQRMLYEYVDLAIRLGCHEIVYGRTAAEIKSTVGAFPVDLTCCILHQRRISNALLSMILNYVKPSEYPQRQPFRAEVLEGLIAKGYTGNVTFPENKLTN